MTSAPGADSVDWVRVTSNSELQLAEIAASGIPVHDRGQAMLVRLRHVLPFDSAWLALANPLGAGYTSLASIDLDEGTRAYLGGPKMANDIEVTGTNRSKPPLSPSDLPYRYQELPTWSECLIPAGYHEALAVALFGEGGRHVGFLALLYRSKQPPATRVRHLLQQVTPVLARGVDPLRSLATAARVVHDATAGIVVCADGGTEPLPGLNGDGLLGATSPVVALARARIHAGQVYASFLWPLERTDVEGFVRVTVLGGTDDSPSWLLGTATLSPVTGLRGLTPRELDVLGLLVDGFSNSQIGSRLFVSPRTVAAHLEHILVKLEAPTRTLAAVRAEREGLYVPPAPAQCRL